MRSRDGGHDASHTGETRGGSSHVPIRAQRSTLDNHTLPPSQDETIRPRDGVRDRPLNRETLSDRLAPLAIPQQATNHPEQPVERGEQNGEARPEDDDARPDDEPLHHETDRARASMTTMRKSMLGAHTARAVKRTRKRNTAAKSHFQCDLSSWGGVICCRPLSHRLTQRQYHAPPVRSQSPRPSPGPR